MIALFDFLFAGAAFMPHGYCLLWRPDLLALHAASDALIAAAYFSIPAAIYVFARQRRDLSFPWISHLFAAFILLCGMTHLISVGTLWVPLYGLEGAAKLLTALVSGFTAGAIWWILPKALALPSPVELQQASDQLAAEVQQRVQADQALRDANLRLERRVAERTQELQEATVRLIEREWALADKTELLETTFNTIDQGICIYDQEQRLVAWNDACARLAIVPPELLQTGVPLIKTIRHVAASGRIEQHRTLDPGGAAQGSLSKRRLIRADDGRVIVISRFRKSDGGQVFTLTDVTEQKRLEDELRHSKERFEIAVSGTDDGVWDRDLRTGEAYYSPVWCKILGLAPDEVPPHTRGWMEGVHPDDLDDVLAKLKAHLAGATEIYQACYRMRHRDGRFIWVEDKGKAVRDERRQPYRLVGTIADVTAHKESVAALADREEMLRTVIETAVDGVVIFDHRGAVEIFNRACQRMFGYGLEDVTGKHASLLLSPAFRSGVDEVIAHWQACDGRRVVEAAPRKVIGVRKDGSTFPAELSIGGGERQGAMVFVGIIRDITERTRAEAALERYAAELKCSNQELEQFAYVASHDLQEPLRMVSGYCELLQRRYRGRLDAEADQFITYAVEGAGRMQGLIRDLLAYSRVGSRGKPLIPIDCNEVLRIALHNLGATIEENQATITADHLPAVCGDQSQLVQLFQNLIGNAIKYRRNEPPVVRIAAERDEGFWSFAVSDNGIGIEPRFANRIFEIFKRLHTRQEYAGSGIGLAICKRIIERHGGEIWLDTEFKQGSRFCFRLPAVEEEGS